MLELAFRARGGDRGNLFAQHWLARLEQGGVGLQVCPVSAPLERLSESALREVLDQIGALHRALRQNGERARLVTTRADVEDDGRIGLMLALEGVEALGHDPGGIEAFWELGVRMVSLTWNRRNAFADGAGEAPGGGLSRLGEDLVDRLVELGAIIDLAHASERTFWDVLERADGAAFVVSHAACRAVLDHPRNLRDEQLRALAERGGVLGLMQLPIVIDHERLTIERVVDHVDHAVAVMGADHVGLGGDFIRQVEGVVGVELPPGAALLPAGMALDAAIEGLTGPEDYPGLVRALEARGYAGERLDAILSGNLLRLFGGALPQ